MAVTQSKATGGGCVLALDQGTTSTRAILFDGEGAPLASAQRELRQILPRPGWVEHDPVEIWEAARDLCAQVVSEADPVSPVAALGVTNQRETVVLWERATGTPVYNAIVWQDRRTADRCAALAARGLGGAFADKTGLLLDPYFSATKIAWLLDHVEGARARAARGELACGTIDSWLIWNLTKGARHVTDVTNASRTMLFNINTLEWDEEILSWLDIPRELLPEVLDCAVSFGVAPAGVLGTELPICGVAGDQQAAAIGQACFSPGMVKSTYGTGCFVLMNTGEERVASRHRLLTTLAYGLDGTRHYAVEGSIFMAGAVVQWLRDNLKVIASAAETEALAAAADPDGAVVLVPAFTGLGAPHWVPQARATLFGLSRDSGVADLVRAALDSICYQTFDLMTAMEADAPEVGAQVLRVDGGMTGNGWFMQRLADILGRPIECPAVAETTALGAAYLAGLQAGLYSSSDAIAERWSRERAFEPRLGADRRAALYAKWRRAVKQAIAWAEEG